MKSITIFIIFSLFMITLVLTSIIPQMIIPDNDDSSSIFSRKNHAPAATSTENKNNIGDVMSPAAKNESLAASLNDNCGLEGYGMDCEITQYLEKELTLPAVGEKYFCAYETIGKSDAGSVIYINYSCQGFSLSGGVVRQGSGVSGPAKLIKGENGSISHWVPRAGSDFYRDLNEFFPSEFRDVAISPKSEKLMQINREQARKYFSADFNYKIEKAGGASCIHDFECQTPDEYLLRSSCPFTSICLDYKCAVVCPAYQK